MSRRKSGLRRLATCAALAVALASPRRSDAVFGVADTGVFHDPVAFAQRASQFIENIAQIRAILATAKEEYELVRGIWSGLKDWRNLEWVDTLDIFQAPWLDDVEGIDDIRRAALAASLSADQVKGLWSDLGILRGWGGTDRYRRDAWFRAKVRSLLRESQQARQTRMAFLKQLKEHNKQITKEIDRLKDLHELLKQANAETPVNMATVAALQHEIAALEAKGKSEGMAFQNQRVLMLLAGADNAHEIYMDLLRESPTWRRQSGIAMSAFGAGFRRRSSPKRRSRRRDVDNPAQRRRRGLRRARTCSLSGSKRTGRCEHGDSR